MFLLSSAAMLNRKQYICNTVTAIAADEGKALQNISDRRFVQDIYACVNKMFIDLRILIVLVPCQSLEIPVDGQMEILTNGSLSKTTFQCNLGYTLKGTSQAICTDDGLWNELPPICGMLVTLLSF